MAVVVSSAAPAAPASAAQTSFATSETSSSTSAATSTNAASLSSAHRAARWGAGWLAAQITAGGGHLVSLGVADPSDTAYAVIGLRAAGVGRAASGQAVAYLKTQLGQPLKYDDGSDDPGRLGYWILAAVSAGQSPYRFGGRAPANNLVARLLHTERARGADAGLFGSGDPTYDGAVRQGVALAALKAAGVPLWTPRVLDALAWLVRQQCPNGLWLGHRVNRTQPCPGADPSTFTGPDTNSTALAVQGLAAYRLFPHRWATLHSLRAVQSADGGFPFLGVGGQASDPDSTALVIQALMATRVSMPAWRKGRHTPVSALESYQLGCSDTAAGRGAFFFPGDRSANVLATVQAVPALAGVPLSVVRPRQVSAAVPHPSCAAGAASSIRPVASLRTAVTTARTGTAGRCTGSTGVTVSVDFTAFRQGVQTRCATGTPTTGLAALQRAGFIPAGTAQYGLAFICRINRLPSTTQQSCRRTPPATAYWASYHADRGATAWTYTTVGASTYRPKSGSIQAWAFGRSARPSRTPAQIRAGK